MRFESEKDMQEHCLKVLKARGIGAAKEVVLSGNLRADIVTNTTIYELKKVLTRECLYQAYGQAQTYNRELNRKHIWIVGQTPTDPIEYRQALNVAQQISCDTVTISFIENDPFWSEASVFIYSNFGGLIAWIRELLIMFGIGLGIAGFFVLLGYFTSRPEPQRYPTQIEERK